MEKVLIFIKHHFSFIWRIIECWNGYIFSIFFSTQQNRVLSSVFKEFSASKYNFRKLSKADASSLHNLINSQNNSDLEYFKPHGFDDESIRRQFRNRSFLMMGAFENDRMIGYFFLRFFINKKCFVGRLIDHNYRGKGIGLVMNKIMYETSWRMGFRCLSTMSKNNASIMRAHAKNNAMVILKELQNDFLLVEFLRVEIK